MAADWVDGVGGSSPDTLCWCVLLCVHVKPTFPESISAMLMLATPLPLIASSPCKWQHLGSWVMETYLLTYLLLQGPALPCFQALKEAQKHLSKSRSPAAAAQMEGLSRRISQLDRFVSAREHMLSDAATSVKICNALVGEVCTSIQICGTAWPARFKPVMWLM